MNTSERKFDDLNGSYHNPKTNSRVNDRIIEIIKNQRVVIPIKVMSFASERNVMPDTFVKH